LLFADGCAVIPRTSPGKEVAMDKPTTKKKAKFKARDLAVKTPKAATVKGGRSAEPIEEVVVIKATR
jgi:hypothetical protein